MNSAESTDPHSGQAADEGPVRVAGDQGPQLLVDSASRWRTASASVGEFAHEGGRGRLAGYDDRLFAGGLQGGFGEPFRFAQAGRPLEIPDEPGLAGASDLGRA